ncbi:2',3'-cyclic nucleotide 2'-phosphodiesterase/3'-nucleotidase bifunctional periplasmic precursor protein [Marinomonas sp. MED121]|uniref:bifunctional 2',3'-cyclic-nucleotide 2'-phosphodiesterase/3'-nucleotidase n=1 Tax=Marinomonas sp. MED121 TaxID=314277 RepID=UPI0000690EC5|nr:bifunctional 2',3'-cyclic-nucleotide 2'-phosphodiesterase/3'-nucleotidase [Marinomonas sp. MED121]EAQ64311.1 2',3'-cyclic nucleotide 2'-phosphodiesterase/3'-nucleotidase bifunctional periplasmic precursor protein [Marinomonas sp. MED121]
MSLLRQSLPFLVGPAIVGSLLLSQSALAQTVALRVMETTDIHMHIQDYDYYKDSQSNSVGLSKVATLIRQARAEVTNSVLVDNGDLLQGTPLGDYVAKGKVLKFGETHPAFKAMNLLGYDAANIGNHEFNYGLDFLMKSLSGANFPYVVANVYFDDGDDDATNDQNYFQPYIIKDKDVIDSEGNKQTIKIGYIGFTPPQIMTWDKANLTGKVISKDIVETARKFVPEMKAKGADVIVAIPHSGMYDTPREGMDEHATYYLAKVEGIDAIMFGHSHRVFPGDKALDAYEGVDSDKGTVFGVAATMPGFWGSHLGVVDLTLEQENGKWQVVDGTGSVRAIAKREGRKSIPLVNAAADINKVVEEDHQGTLAYMRKKVGETTADINSFFALVQDDPSIQVVNQAQTWYVKNIVQGTSFDGLPILSAGAPFKAGGRGGADYYTDVKKGDIALKNVSDLYIYPNDLKVVKLNGAQIVEWLEFSAGQFNQIDTTNTSSAQQLVNTSFPTYNFDVIDGINYQIDVTQPARYESKGAMVSADNQRIKNVTFQGKAIDLSQDFLVATNNYRAGGGGHFPNLDGSTIVIDAPDKNRDVVANYLLSQSTISPKADGNWEFADTLANTKVVFKTSPKGKAVASDNVEFDKDLDDGFAQFLLK